MTLANSRPKLIWKILNNALGRKSVSTDYKLVIDKIRSHEIVSGNNSIGLKFKKHFANVGNTDGENFSVSYAFDYHMNSAYENAQAKFSTVSF